MALSDLEVFIRERAAVFDESMDASVGSPFDLQVIQPILRRLGTDPYSVDFQTFALTMLNQEYPDMSTKEGDAITDLLIKPATFLWDPILREQFRIRNSQSFRDATTLTTEEAEALGANLFSQLDRGNQARGVCRLYYPQPQNAAVNPANFFSSRTGLHFYPTENQSISVHEMLFNLESSLYYFDVNVIAEKPGDEYNIGVDEISSVANMPAVTRVTNKRRFRFGVAEEDAVSFIDRTEQELTERSMVTLRGIAAVLTKAFPEVTRLGVVGFNDPEMGRDVITGGGLGPLRAFGVSAIAVPDGENQPRTRRLDMSAEAGLDFTALIGPSSVIPTGWVLTLVAAFFGDAPVVRDLTVRRIVSATQIDLEEQVVYQDNGGGNYTWMLRKKEITLSRIPGGILFPDGPNGTVAVPPDQIHIGGATDILVRGPSLDTASVIIDNLSDDSPLLSGIEATISGGLVTLGDYTLNANYQVDDLTYTTLRDAQLRGYTLQLLEGAAAGSYRIIGMVQNLAASPVITLDPTPLVAPGSIRWRLLDEIDVELAEPKETRIAAADLITVLGTNTVTTNSAVDFDELGVSAGDILRVVNGPDAGDFTVVQVLAPFFQHLQVDRQFLASNTGVTYRIFRKNAEDGVQLPLVRVTSIDLLDTSGQPVGSKIPYAKAVDVRSSGFANFASGVKSDVLDARLGLTSLQLSGAPPGANVTGLTLILEWDGGGPQVVTFTGPNPISVANIIGAINTAIGRRVAFIVDDNRFGITPIGGVTRITGGTALVTLFGGSNTEVRSSRDIRSDKVDSIGGWGSLSPAINVNVDVAQVLDGFQIGFFSHPRLGSEVYNLSTALITDQSFGPEANRHLQVGTRSIGNARVYFLEPTSVEFDTNTRFRTTVNGVPLSFLPDPTLSAQKIPALPSGAKPMDGSSQAAGNDLFSATDFIKKQVQTGDTLIVDFWPLTGTANLTDPVALLALTTLVLSIDGGPDKPITFVNDSTAIASTSVTRAGVADQINKAVGKTICKIAPSGALNFLEFEFDGSVIVRKTGTANVLLGFSTSADQNNTSPHAGSYYIDIVFANQLIISSGPNNDFPPSFPSSPLGFMARQQFKVSKPGAQRIGSTSMSSQVAEASLYYMDVELVSEGTGNLWNITSDLPMTVEGYTSDGYYLTTDNSDLTFSPAEPVRLHLSRSIREVGVSDDPENATQLSGQNIRVNYERSSVTASVENFVTSETERVVCSSPLARHLIPHFVRFDLSYVGGSKENIVIPEVESYIREISPDDFLEVSDVEKILSDSGATSITNPVDLVAVVHNVDRSVSLDRSKNRLNTGRLAAFIPDILNIVRKVS